MNKIIGLLIFVSIALNSCTLFKSKETLLTEKEWILYSRTVSNVATLPNSTFFKKSSKPIVLRFYKGGLLEVDIENGKSHEMAEWSFTKDGKILIDCGKYDGELEINELTGTTFKWSSYKTDKEELISEEFKHDDDKEWDDNSVDVINRMMSH